MDGFLDPYWDLDRVIAWAVTRDPVEVRAAGQPTLPDVALTTRQIAGRTFMTALRQKEKKGGRDVEAELWHASGWEPNDFRKPALQGPFPRDDNPSISQQDTPRTVYFYQFPIGDYLLSLLRQGKLNASGTPAVARPARPISPVEWAGIELRVDRDDGRLGVFAVHGQQAQPIFRLVRIARDEVLEEFPAARPTDPRAPVTEAMILGLLRPEWEKLGDKLTQNRALEIVRSVYPETLREDIRQAYRTLNPHPKPGPKGPRK